MQGARIDGLRHWLGTSRERRLLCLAAILWLLGRDVVWVKDVERVVGKLSYCMSFRSCCRSVLVYVWMVGHAHMRKQPQALSPAAWYELLLAALALPLMQHDLSADWCCRSEACDAAPGGHGRAWAHLPLPVIQEMARWADTKAVRTNIPTEFGIEVDDADKCPLARVRLPQDCVEWHTLAKPGGWMHITLEESHARLWSLEARLRRPSELGSRVLIANDNAPCVGAAIRGCSASRALNLCCRRSAAIEISGGFMVFDFWVRSEDDPADEPSSR